MSSNSATNKQLIQNSVIKIQKHENVLIWLTYRATYPIAKFLIKFPISPNSLTILSLSLVGVTNVLLTVRMHQTIFTIIWVVSILLDFMDGQVARLTGKVRDHSFSFDHTSDLLKISSTIIALSIYYATELIWVTAPITMCMILLSDRLNTDLAFALRDQQISSVTDTSMYRSPFVTNIYTVFFTFNSHSLFLFPLMIINENLCAVILLYFTVISSISCVRFVYVLANTPKN
jgi:phosphatidylglycerophosphate synthase